MKPTTSPRPRHEPECGDEPSKPAAEEADFPREEAECRAEVAHSPRGNSREVLGPDGPSHTCTACMPRRSDAVGLRPHTHRVARLRSFHRGDRLPNRQPLRLPDLQPPPRSRPPWRRRSRCRRQRRSPSTALLRRSPYLRSVATTTACKGRRRIGTRQTSFPVQAAPSRSGREGWSCSRSTTVRPQQRRRKERTFAFRHARLTAEREEP